MNHNELVTLNENNVPTTTSLKVAEYFDKQHYNVLNDIRTYIDGGVLGFQESNYLNKQNKSQPMYTMDRKAFMILTMGFTGEKALKFKQDFVDAFDAMEAELQKRQSPFEIPQTLSEALQLAADQAKQLELMEPKAEAFDTYLDTENTMSLTEAAKCLGMTGHRLGKILRDDGVLWKQHVHKKAPNLPRAGYEEYFEAVRVKPKGQNHTWPQTRVTPAGLEWLRQNYSVTTPNLKVV